MIILMDFIYFETHLNYFVSKYVVAQYIFILLSNVLWSSITSCYNILFLNLKVKKYSIIISAVIKSYGSHANWDILYIPYYERRKKKERKWKKEKYRMTRRTERVQSFLVPLNKCIVHCVVINNEEDVCI